MRSLEEETVTRLDDARDKALGLAKSLLSLGSEPTSGELPKAKTRKLAIGLLTLACAGIADLRLWAQNPVPLVNQPLVPAAAAPGGPGFTLTVNGTGFVSGSVVNWNANPRPTTFISGSQLTASIAAADIATAGTASVTVVNPTPGGGASNVALFQITVPAGSLAFTNVDFPLVFQPLSLVAADFNNDGKLDLATATAGSDVVSVLLGKGDGSLQTPA